MAFLFGFSLEVFFDLLDSSFLAFLCLALLCRTLLHRPFLAFLRRPFFALFDSCRQTQDCPFDPFYDFRRQQL